MGTRGAGPGRETGHAGTTRQPSARCLAQGMRAPPVAPLTPALVGLLARLPLRSPGRSFCRERASPALKTSSSATLRVSRGLDSCDCPKESHSPALTQRHTPGPALYPHPVTSPTHGVSCCFRTKPPHCRPATCPRASLPPLAPWEPSLRGAAPASLGLFPIPQPTVVLPTQIPAPGPAASVLFSTPPSPRAGPAIPGALGLWTLSCHRPVRTPQAADRGGAATFLAAGPSGDPLRKAVGPDGALGAGYHDHLPDVGHLAACRCGSLGFLQGVLQNAKPLNGLSRCPLGAPPRLALRWPADCNREWRKVTKQTILQTLK